ncbi:hypothetical protein BJY52DRAFT_1228020 [Lactarius psammicola]|nr:hypothetical protein BJY52DRAFT_1228020 [Lactarius psammicola]
MGDRSAQSNDLLSAHCQYWSDAVQSRLSLVDDILRQVPPSTLSDATAFNLVNDEMSAMLCVLRAVGSRRNALTLTCRIPTEILVEIFLHYQRSYFALDILVEDKEKHSTLYGTSLGWVPAVAHVCRHWRTVAHEHPRLWSEVVLHMGRAWAQRMLALSKASPIVVSLTNPIPCEAIMTANGMGLLPRPRRPALDPLDVLVDHLFHIKDLEFCACACVAPPWVCLLETAAPFLEELWLRIDPHDPGTLPDAPIALPDNFLATHPRLRRLVIEEAFLASWVPGTGPLKQLVTLSIAAPDPRHAASRAASVLPTHEQLLECLELMPVLEVLCIEHCLPAFVSTFSSRTVSLPHLRVATLADRVDRCRQVLDALDVPPATIVTVRCWSVSPPSELDCLRILPSLAAHLSRPILSTPPSPPTGSGGPRALALSSASSNGRTLLTLTAWRAFITPTVAEDCEPYAGPKAIPDIRLDCEWDAGDPDMERRALQRACACVPLADLRALSVRTDAAVWSMRDWRATFTPCLEITHVMASDVPAESLLEALSPPPAVNTDDDDDGSERGPLFQELVSLTLVGVNFVRTEEEAWFTLASALVQRQKSPACVTILDRIELRACTVAEDAIDSLKEFAAVVVWDSVTDPNSWIHIPREGGGDEEGGDGEEEAE